MTAESRFYIFQKDLGKFTVHCTLFSMIWDVSFITITSHPLKLKPLRKNRRRSKLTYELFEYKYRIMATETKAI